MNDQQIRLDQLIERLRERRCRITPQRVAILQALLEAEGHPSVEEIYEEVRKTFPMTSLATVYKTIALLREIGEVLELEFEPSGNRYDAHHPEPHPHLICTRCGRIDDGQAIPLEVIQAAMAASPRFAVRGYRLDIYGLCLECQRSGDLE
ncbi:MAG: transcriptional repressor [Thermanaerothrix sp.]|nr:transcriptional repressor [Thermanaerothrix sp.]